MLSMKKHMQLSIADLRWLVIACAKCQTEVTLDVSLKLSPESDRDSLTPSRCPSCETPYASIVAHVDKFREAYAGLSKPGKGVSFRVSADAE